jgi:hypothetical protein
LPSGLDFNPVAHYPAGRKWAMVYRIWFAGLGFRTHADNTLCAGVVLCCADPLEAMQEVMDKTQWGPACVFRRVDNMIHGKHQVKAVSPVAPAILSRSRSAEFVW